MLYYIYNGSELLGFVYNNNTYYYHKNMFGDIIGILDSDYNEVVSYEYDSWGALVNITDNSSINLGTINPFRYRSYYYDNETKLYYLNSRYYNPEIGRFINADSVVLANQDIISGNIFQYVSNCPIMNCDKSGKFVDAIFDFGVKLGNALREAAPFWGTAGGLSAVDGPLPFGDIIGGAIAVGGTAWALYESYNIGKTKSKEKAESIEKVEINAFRKQKENKAYFPENPLDFKPNGLVPVTYAGSSNGAIIKWGVPGTDIEVFEWNEDFKNGSHYHIRSLAPELRRKDQPHFRAGDEVPEPYASIFFG